MIYNGRLTPPYNWPPLIRYPRNYYPDRRLSILWFLVLAIIALVLSIIALIIVFSIEHSWFHDSFGNSITRYGLWRLCFFGNDTCVSWFAPGETYSAKVEERLNLSRVGINAWQALEIIFLFLTTATFIIATVSIIFYGLRSSLHYYAAILAVFCVWPAASVGVTVLFVFGFAVYNVAPSVPYRDLDWCFYLNLVAVILSVIAAILLSIYDALLKKPIKRTVEDDTIVETFADLNGYPAALSPSTFVIVRRNKRKRNKPYEYPQVLHPNHYFQTVTGGIQSTNPNFELRRPPNQQMLTPYTSVVITEETTTTSPQQPKEPQRQISPPPPPPPPITSYRTVEYNCSNLVSPPPPPPKKTYLTVEYNRSDLVPPPPPQPPILSETRPFRAPVTTYQYHPQSATSQWNRSETNVINPSLSYVSEPTHNYTQRSFHYPNRSNVIERTFERKQEPRLLHYYTGYDYFATVDPSDAVLTRHHPPITGSSSAIRFSANPTYHQNDFIKSTF